MKKFYHSLIKELYPYSVSLLLVVLVSILLLVLYMVVQQNYRQSANDPQIQIAKDYATLFASGFPSQRFNRARKIDIAKSLDTFVMIFDKNGSVLASTAQLDGKTPTVPHGVFEAVSRNGEARFTWQPKDDVRSAVVVDAFNGSQLGYILVGRSISEVEIREQQLGEMIALGWSFAMLCIVGYQLAFGSYLLKNKLMKPHSK